MPPETNDPDVKVIAALAVEESNFSKPHKVDFFLYFPNEKMATEASKEIKGKYSDFDTRVDPPLENYTEYLCKVEAKLVPSLDVMRTIRENFTKIAGSFQGKYDGWGAEINK